MKIIIGIIIGSVVGFGVGYFGRCVSGACPLTGNPLITTLLGAGLGVLFVLGK